MQTNAQQPQPHNSKAGFSLSVISHFCDLLLLLTQALKSPIDALKLSHDENESRRDDRMEDLIDRRDDLRLCHAEKSPLKFLSSSNDLNESPNEVLALRKECLSMFVLIGQDGSSDDFASSSWADIDCRSLSSKLNSFVAAGSEQTDRQSSTISLSSSSYSD